MVPASTLGCHASTHHRHSSASPGSKASPTEPAPAAPAPVWVAASAEPAQSAASSTMQALQGHAEATQPADCGPVSRSVVKHCMPSSCAELPEADVTGKPQQPQQALVLREEHACPGSSGTGRSRLAGCGTPPPAAPGSPCCAPACAAWHLLHIDASLKARAVDQALCEGMAIGPSASMTSKQPPQQHSGCSSCPRPWQIPLCSWTVT